MAPVNRFSVIGLPNYAAQPFVVISTSYYDPSVLSASLPLTNLQTEEPSKVGRVLSLDPEYTFFPFTVGSTSIYVPRKDFNGFALVNVNLSRFGKYRVIGDTFAASVNLNRSFVTPDAILSSTNITGAVTNIDEFSQSPDALWITPTDKNLAWDVRLSFNTPPSTPRTGADMQAIVLWARRQGADTSASPLIRVELWESGAYVATLGTRMISSGTGQTLVFTWNASLLSTASGANVEVKIFGRGYVSAYGELGAVTWRAEHSSYDYDSGWLPSPFSNSNDIDMCGPQPTKSLHYIPDTPWTNVKWWAWLWADDQTDADAAETLWDDSQLYSVLTGILTPQGYIQAGVSIGGYTFVSARGQRLDSPYDVGVLTEERGGVTEGGQTYAADAFRRRRAAVNLFLNRDEGADLMDRLDWRRGHSSPVFIVIEPAVDSGLQLFHSFYATVADAGALSPLPQKYEAGAEMVFQKTYLFEERL